ncbi:type II toxin-antitoxin system Phd/YefM family antitoxin [Candidatus Gracilibacteria bacterium]|nr:type II toxin-antitoxin system Phd/YefM family antitoxin [Candidatus Gracilibacteria bacterium]
MIAEDNFVSISEVRDNTSHFFKTLPKARKRFVMSHNKPVGVVMSLEEYNHSQIPVAEPDQWEIEATLKDLESIDDEGVDAFEFLAQLQQKDVHR